MVHFASLNAPYDPGISAFRRGLPPVRRIDAIGRYGRGASFDAGAL